MSSFLIQSGEYFISLLNGCHTGFRQGGCINERSGKIDQVIPERCCSQHNSSMTTHGFTKSMDPGKTVAMQLQVLRKAFSFFSDNSRCMGFIDDQVGPMIFTKRQYLMQRRQIAIHRKNRFGNHEYISPGCPELFFQVCGVIMPE